MPDTIDTNITILRNRDMVHVVLMAYAAINMAATWRIN